jgi:hypothetical protein
MIQGNLKSVPQHLTVYNSNDPDVNEGIVWRNAEHSRVGLVAFEEVLDVVDMIGFRVRNASDRIFCPELS